jgi:hypothetical protein
MLCAITSRTTRTGSAAHAAASASARARFARANGNAADQPRGWHAADRHQPWRFQTDFIVLEHVRPPAAHQIILRCSSANSTLAACVRFGEATACFSGSEGAGQRLISEGSTSGQEHFCGRRVYLGLCASVLRRSLRLYTQNYNIYHYTCQKCVLKVFQNHSKKD